jgi:predicted permease
MMLMRRLWYLLNRRRYERELIEEMREHRAAMHDPSTFGDTHRMLERSRDAWGWNWLDDAAQDFAVGLRMLWRAPVFAITATLILTFGIGLNVTLYQMVYVAMFKPPAVAKPESWARFHRAMKNGSSTAVPYPVAEFIATHNDVLDAVLIEASDDIAWGRDAEGQVEGSFVSSNWFDELGYGPLHGRVFSDALDAGGGGVTGVVVGYRFWRNRLGANPDIVGTTAYLDRKPVVIVGVAPLELPGLDFDAPDVFIPVAQREYFYPHSEFLRAWRTDSVAMYGRFKDGVTPAAAREALRGVMASLAAEGLIDEGMWLQPLLATSNFMRTDERREVMAVLSLVATLTAIVLCVAAANLGNLVMSRATGRVRELGVRMALGARRARIVRQLVVEAAPLVLLGAIGSLAFAAATTTGIAALAEFPPYVNFTIDWRTMAVALAMAGVALIVVGVLPAWKVAHQHLIDAIKDGGQHVSRVLDRVLLRRVLMSAQVAGSCLLLIVAGMMVRSVQRVVAGNPGFDYERAAVLSAPLARYGLAEGAAHAYWSAVKDRLRAHPEVEQAAIVTAAPLGGRVFETIYDSMGGLSVMTQAVDPEYFDTMKIRLIAGRLFAAGEPDVVIVSRRLALSMYGTLDVLGRPFPNARNARPEGLIVGVAADAHSIKVNATNVTEMYKALDVGDYSDVTLVARARTDAGRLLPVLRHAAAVDPRIVPEVRALRDDFDRRMRGPRVAGAIASGIGVLTLLLACLGIFGMVSYGIALRTKEIGIRIAVGASQPALVRAILQRVSTPIGAGVLAGLMAAVPIGRAMSGDPFYVQPSDPFAFAAGLAIFVLTGAIAALIPAVAVLRGNPVDALRNQ